MTTAFTNVAVRHRSVTVVVGTPVRADAFALSYPMTVTAAPGGGGSLLIEYSTTPNASDAAIAATASWSNWPYGTVTARTSGTLISPITAMRFTATTADGVVEICA